MDGVVNSLSVFFFICGMLLFSCGPLLLAWVADGIWGDPPKMPHLIVLFGRIIGKGERRLNRGAHRFWKGLLFSLLLVVLAFFLTWLLLHLVKQASFWLYLPLEALLIFYCLAGTTLIREVKSVFLALDRSLDEGRKQVARIVGRDTSELSDQEVRKAALETLAENLSDGVVAPLFWFALLGAPGMVAYKMVNTLDSMIGYHTVRYKDFGCFAARVDDVANWIPARLTALLMVLCSGKWRLLNFVWRNGRKHLSPNSGYPEAALAGILNCRFGGPHTYFGELVDKPYIGEEEKWLTSIDMWRSVRLNRMVETVAVALTVISLVV